MTIVAAEFVEQLFNSSIIPELQMLTLKVRMCRQVPFDLSNALGLVCNCILLAKLGEGTAEKTAYFVPSVISASCTAKLSGILDCKFPEAYSSPYMLPVKLAYNVNEM